MYWWDRAAALLAARGSRLKRFGFVTTNSVTQEFSRRVMAKRLDGPSPLHLEMAVPDHPWTRATPDSAAVRIAMTVVAPGEGEGVLYEVASEAGLDSDQPRIAFMEARGRIHPDLTVGADVTLTRPLRANAGLSSPGMKLHGAGFIVTPAEAEYLGLGRREGLDRHIRPYRNGRDLTARARGAMVMDFFGLEEGDVRRRFPEAYGHLLRTVKPSAIETTGLRIAIIGGPSESRAVNCVLRLRGCCAISPLWRRRSIAFSSFWMRKSFRITSCSPSPLMMPTSSGFCRRRII